MTMLNEYESIQESMMRQRDDARAKFAAAERDLAAMTAERDELREKLGVAMIVLDERTAERDRFHSRLNMEVGHSDALLESANAARARAERLEAALGHIAHDLYESVPEARAVARAALAETGSGETISVTEARRLALDAQAQAETRRQDEREREAAIWQETRATPARTA